MPEFRNPALTVDAVIYRRSVPALLLIRRKNQPFQGFWALPGGFVEYGETVENACRREALEETGLVLSEISLLSVYSDPDRDPRFHTVSIVFSAYVPDLSKAVASDDACETGVFDLSDVLNQKLAFDHRQIVRDFLSLKHLIF
ncbi:MAG: NUDIX hydrolase [Candidatus Wallbacteria bacterium]|nr:NUDIX hydrolase [Candidatus Wallbacteria bacterium]